MLVMKKLRRGVEEELARKNKDLITENPDLNDNAVCETVKDQGNLLDESNSKIGALIPTWGVAMNAVIAKKMLTAFFRLQCWWQNIAVGRDYVEISFHIFTLLPSSFHPGDVSWVFFRFLFL